MSRLILQLTATSIPTGAFSRSSTLVLDQLSIAHMGSNLSFSAQRSRYRRQQRLVLPTCHRLWSSSAAFMNPSCCRGPLPVQIPREKEENVCKPGGEGWRFGRRQIRPLRRPRPRPRPRPSRPRVLSNFRHRLAAVSASQHPLSLIISRGLFNDPDPSQVILHQLRSRRQQDSQWSQSPSSAASEKGMTTRTEPISAPRIGGVLQTDSSVLDDQRGAPRSKRAAPWNKDEGRQHGKSLPYILPSSHSPCPRRPREKQCPSCFCLPSVGIVLCHVEADGVQSWSSIRIFTKPWEIGMFLD